ncbi:MAG: winged helix DNA-binding domain-containing protein [Solirubrobacteraceae bacterium]
MSDGAAVHAERLSAQLLSGEGARDPPAVARRLLAVQGQDGRGARLAIRARSTGLSAADVDRALTDERSLLITWVNRGTLHLLCSEDYPWLHALTAPPLLAANARRLAQEGLTADAADRGVEVIVRSLADDGPLTRVQLRDRIAAAGVRTQGQALIHLLMLASLRGLTVRGPMIGPQHAYVLVSDWLPAARPVDRDAALAELARRYLLGHGPANERDLAKWAGLPLRDVRAGLSAIAAELAVREDGLLSLRASAPDEGLPPPQLLGAFDPVLLGWTSRERIIGRHVGLVTAQGLFRPFALVGGRAVAVWGFPRGAVELRPLERISRADRSALNAEAVAVERFLGSPAG